MAKPKRQSKKKSSRRAQNAFEIASAQANAADSSEDEISNDAFSNGAIINSRKFTKGRRNDDEDDEDDDEEFEDEEIDSDEAMGSDDDYDVLNSKFSQSIRDKAQRKKKAKKEGISLDESEDEEDGYQSVDESEFVGLSEAWDLDEKDKKQSKRSSDDLVLDEDDWESESEQESDEDSEESDSEDDDEDEEEEGESLFPDSEDDNENDSEVELTTLKKSLTKLDPIKSKKYYQSSTVAENELSLPGGGSEITLSDMLSVIDPTASKEAALINRDLETPGAEDSNKPLAVPLPKRIQQRNDRKVAYELTKDEVSKWDETVRTLRNTEVLKFPLAQQEEEEDSDDSDDENKGINKSKKREASTFDDISEPMNDLESRIGSILQESKLVDDTAESKFEEIQTAKLSKAELQKRQSELRRMRELMFRQERDARRIKKIKSKSYHRIKKKELLKTQQIVDEANGDDFEDDEDLEMKRAHERMSLKHKNNSKWAQRMIKSGMSKDSESRGEMEEMLRRGEKLKAKILGREEGDLDEFNDLNDSDIDRDDVQIEDEDEIREKTGKTGVMNMAFMKNAEARERTANEEYKAKLRKLNHDEDIAEFEKSLEDGQDNSGVNVQLNTGRRVYAPGAQDVNTQMKNVAQDVLDEDEIDQSKSLTNRLTSGHDNRNKRSKPLQSTNIDEPKKGKQSSGNEDDEDANPWLMADDDSNDVLKSKKLTILDESSSKLDKSAAKISKKRKAIDDAKRSKSKDKEEDELINMNETLRIIDPHADNDDEDNGSEVDDDSAIHMFKQKDLIKQAFAGDDVISEFNEEKRQTIADEEDQVEDLSMPGWGGDWAGGNNKKRKKNHKPILKVTKGVNFDQRKDKSLNNVIINEKLNKKNAKYESVAVPFPFESREQYERSLRMPIGQEWTSREAHQRLTMPKVIAKSGIVINPLKKPNK